MATLSSSMFLFKSPPLFPFNSPSQFNPSLLPPLADCSNYNFPHQQSLIENQTALGSHFGRGSQRRFSSRGNYTEEDDTHIGGDSFDEAVRLFNHRDYYKCHDILEALWNKAQEPTRTLIHGILQCAVGFHHLFNQNHRGATMELGEGLCKLRKMNFDGGPFLQFEQEISSVLDFIYQTQLELAACTDDMCITLDQSERSYQLLGGYAAGQLLYRLESDSSDTTVHIVFRPERSYETEEPPRVKLPTLLASEEHIRDMEYNALI